MNVLDPRKVAAVRSLEAMNSVVAGVDSYGILSDEATEHPVYESLCALFRALGLGAEHKGGDWNPLGDVIGPGERVLIKPNLVFHRHYRGGALHGVITDPRLIRAMADFVFRAIGPEGELVIGDAPLQSADWEELCARTGLGGLPGYYARKGLRCSLRDFRRVTTTTHRGLKLNMRENRGDPAGYRAVNLGEDSLHFGREWERFRVTNYDPTAMRSHHDATKHEYLVSGSLLQASTVINMAKLKTHRKSGLTGPLKNFIGINGCKDWLPHHTKGSTESGGDEYRQEARWKGLSTWLVEREETISPAPVKRGIHTLRKAIWLAGKRLASDTTWEGSWYGNDTLWRTILDLNRAALYADSKGDMQHTPQRKFLVLVDALLAGEGEGPMAPSPAPMGVLLGGMCAPAVEWVAAELAGWPQAHLPHLSHAFESHRYTLAGFSPAEIHLDCREWSQGGLAPAQIEALARSLAPSSGWKPVFEQSRENVGA